MWAMWLCSAYVGSNTSALRSGPPKASSRLCSTSLDPLAANTFAGDTRVQLGDGGAQLGGRAIGVAVELDVGDGIGQRRDELRRRRQRRLVGVEPHVDVNLRRVVALHATEVGTNVDASAVAPHANGLSVRGEAFGLGERDDVRGDAVQRGLVERHDVHGADEIVDAQTPRRNAPSRRSAARGSARRCSRRRWPERTPRRTRRRRDAPAASSDSGSADISCRCSGATALATAIASSGPSTSAT